MIDNVTKEKKPKDKKNMRLKGSYSGHLKGYRLDNFPPRRFRENNKEDFFPKIDVSNKEEQSRLARLANSISGFIDRNMLPNDSLV